jgi:hypothetical protein
MVRGLATSGSRGAAGGNPVGGGKVPKRSPTLMINPLGDSLPVSAGAKLFDNEREGLGGASIHGNFTHLGEDVKVPEFLRQPKTASIIGCPMSYGQPKAGTDQGPMMLRDAGLHKTLAALEWRVNERGDLKFDPPTPSDPQFDEEKYGGKARNSFAVGNALKKIHDAVYGAVKDDEFALVLGGDHSLSAGSVSAVLRARPETGIIWGKGLSFFRSFFFLYLLGDLMLLYTYMETQCKHIYVCTCVSVCMCHMLVRSLVHIGIPVNQVIHLFL